MYRVLKFGGSSVASATAMSGVLDIVEKEAARGKVILVSSAISGCTDELLAIAAGDTARIPALLERHRDIVTRLFTGAERDAVLSRVESLFAGMEEAPADEKVTFGELFSTTILAAKLRCDGYRTLWLDSRELIVRDDPPLSYRRIREALREEADIYVAPGFICREASGKVSTLGRGGSDYSAALYAAAVQADSLQIWTDVSGIMTADPRRIPQARTVPKMSYGEALLMASHGAKVLYAPTVAPAMEAGIAIEIRNTFAPGGAWTEVGDFPPRSDAVGVTSQQKAENLSQICLVAPKREEELRKVLREAGIAPLAVRAERDHLLLDVRPAVEQAALKALHRAYFEALPVERLHLFIAGNGAVGQALSEMVSRSAATVLQRTGKEICVVGRADSRRFSIDLSSQPGEPSCEGDYVDAVCAAAPRGSIFIDCTDSETLYRRYPQLFAAGISVVSSNRRSFSVPYVEYAALQAAARENGAALRYETTVGAALPILESISRGANSCDEIYSIEAVVSCTLNQIWSDYVPGKESFATLVRRAHQAGLTESDPRLDLGGRDVLRKLLILSREAGVPLEEDDIELEPVIPASLLNIPIDAFYERLEVLEPEFSDQARAAYRQGCRRRFVAWLEKRPEGYKAGIREQLVSPEHPAYYLRGTENAIIIRSALHPYPLVILGPGEGAREAASSILNDILR